jgi:hypothetical protein
MTDLATLVLSVDSTSVATGTVALDGLTAAGGRAEAATAGLTTGWRATDSAARSAAASVATQTAAFTASTVAVRGVGAAATEMAATAQASARAVTVQAASFTASTDAVRLNNIAMRETMVLGRELSRGNYSRVPGSLSYLAQGIGQQGGLAAYGTALLNTFGILKTVQNAELAEEAANAAAAATAVESASSRAAANIISADTELALAQSAVVVSTSSEAEAAAQARVVVAHEAVTAAAAEAAIAEDALGIAQGRAATAAEASAAATISSLNPIAVVLGVVAAAAAVLYFAFRDSKDPVEKATAALEKHAAQAKANAEAEKIFSDTIDAVTEALGKNQEALDKLADSEKTAAERALDTATAEGVKALAIAKSTVTILDQQKAEFGYAKDTSFGAAGGAGAGAATSAYASQLATGEAALAQAKAAVIAAQQQVTDAQSFVTVQHASADAAELIKKKYDALIETTRQQYLAQNNVGDALARQVEILKAKEQLELNSLKNADAQHGKQVSFAGAEAIAQGAGLHVTSGYRSYAQQAQLYNTVRTAANPVAAPGTSAHEGLNGKWALDIAFAPGLSPASLKKLYGDQGVSLSAVYKETGHYHIEGSTSQATAAQKATDAAAKKAEAAANTKLEQDKAFYDLSSQLNKQITDAQRKLAGGAAEQAQFQLDDITIEQAKTITDAQAALALKKITPIEEHKLELLANDLAALKAAAVMRALQVQLITEQLAAQDQAYQFQTDGLTFDDAVATTQAEHRKIQLDMLDIAYQRKAADLQGLLLQQLINNKLSDAALTQGQINNLPVEQARAQVLVAKNTMNPLQAWEDAIPKSRDTIMAALQTIETQGFDNLASSIAGVVTGTQSLGAAFKSVASTIISDIIQMIVKMTIFRAVSSIMGGGVGSAFSGSGSDAAVGSGIYGNIGSLGLPGMASGGSFLIGGAGGTDSNVLSINGQPRALVSAGETVAVLPSSPGGRRAANNNAPQVSVTVNVDAKDAVLTNAVKGWIVQAIVQAAPTLVAASTKSTMRAASRPRLMGR